jgi:hypothetical protein
MGKASTKQDVASYLRSYEHTRRRRHEFTVQKSRIVQVLSARPFIDAAECRAGRIHRSIRFQRWTNCIPVLRVALRPKTMKQRVSSRYVTC